MPSSTSYGSLPFAEQIAFFRRKMNLPTQSWTDIWQEAHDHAFVVAGANTADLVADFRAAVDKAIAKGTTLAEFRKDFDAIVEKHGWVYNGGRNWRSRLIYETNLRSSYSAGRYAQLQAVKKVRPFWQYEHSDAVEHPRPHHLAWNGLILHADDPWWDEHFPINGWGCHCRVRSLAMRDLRRMGKEGPDQAPPSETVVTTVGIRGPSPRVVETPVGIDPGFAYSPGRGAFEQLAQLALEKAAKLPAAASAANAAEPLAIPRIATALAEGYAKWQRGIVAANQSRNTSFMVGSLDVDLVNALTARGIEPATAVIAARDVEVLHALRQAKAAAQTATGKPKAFVASELEHLPELLANPEAILLDVEKRSLLYIFPAQRRPAGKLVIGIDYSLKTDAGVQRVNSFRTAQLIEYADVTKDVKAGKLALLRGTL